MVFLGIVKHEHVRDLSIITNKYQIYGQSYYENYEGHKNTIGSITLKHIIIIIDEKGTQYSFDLKTLNNYARAFNSNSIIKLLTEHYNKLTLNSFIDRLISVMVIL